MKTSNTTAALALCILSSALSCAAFLAFELFVLTWVCFVPVLFAVMGASTLRRAFAYSVLFGTVANAGGFYWTTELLSEFGQLPLPVSALAFVLLSAFQGLRLALVITLVREADRRLGVAPVWSLPVLLVSFEWLYPVAFPNYMGNSQFLFRAITQIADVTGVLGLTALVALLNGAFYELVESMRRSGRIRALRLAVPAGAFVVSIVYGMIRLPAIESATAAADSIRIAVPQTNIGQRAKESDLTGFLQAHIDMSAEILAADADIDLMIWPETVLDGFVEQRGGSLVGTIDLGLEVPLILGLPSFEISQSDETPRLFNTAALVDTGGNVLGSFDKVHLIAFGETVPFSDRFPFLETLLPNVGGFTRGTSFQSLNYDGLSMLPMICYEDLFPSLTRRIWKASGPADFLVNVTNDSWYGDTHEPMQHLALASLRSIETRRSLVRSTNTGISAVIDPAGRIVSRTGQWTREALVADVPLITDGSSTFYMRFGDLLGWASAGLVLAGLVVAVMRRGRRRL